MRLILGALRFAVKLGCSHKVVRHYAGVTGMTPLHVAAIFGHSEICDMLVAAGADPTMRNAQGPTPLEAFQRSIVGCARRSRISRLEQQEGEATATRKGCLHPAPLANGRMMRAP
jgi:hypothetical protein|mmetsp:Transcript_52068/g.153672  ORF Transcript_52068/g.153672 Transcript_52068/m.153672 type:complete len:115 (+) Transcript_52068:1290-1634(+)|eukprot:6407525-Prymnesium_polylepis.2